MSAFVAIREGGTWKRGRWIVAESERCTHRHKTEAVAVECLRRWNGGYSHTSSLDCHRNGYGTIICVADDGAESVARVVRPDRHVERRFVYGGVTGTWRHWNFHGEYLVANRPVEIEIACGSWSATYTGTRDVGPTFVQGWVCALHLLFEQQGPDALVAMHRAMLRTQPAQADDRGVLVLGPWRQKPE